MADIFNDSGIIVEGLDEVRSNMKADAEVKFADILDGKPLRADDSSILGRLFAITAKPKVETSELLPQIIAAFDANQVEDQQADNLFGQLWGIPRLSPSQATGLLILSGDIGTLVAKGSEVTNYITGDSYSIDSDVTFGNVSVNGVVIENTLTGANTWLTSLPFSSLIMFWFSMFYVSIKVFTNLIVRQRTPTTTVSDNATKTPQALFLSF